MMRILIASDSFKDALSAPDVCRAIAGGIGRRYPEAEIVEFPLADGGEGTFEVLALHLGLQTVETDTVDPLFRPIRAPYGLSADGHTALIEMAKASGLQLLEPGERNPLNTTTFGTGLLLADAFRRGVKHAVLAIGGSATNDAGTGMAAALGWQFRDADWQAVKPTGRSLEQIVKILPPADYQAFERVEVICDVTNSLYGPQGAAHVYGRQKGADDEAIALLDAGLRHFAQIAERQLGKPGLAALPGAGAAGGTGFGAMVFLGATLRRGIDLVMDLTHFDQALESADLVITGEGKLDGQTLHGKLIHGICQRARRKSVPVIALCGQLTATHEQIAQIGLRNAYSINDTELPLPEMLARTAENLTRAAALISLE